MRAVVTGAAGFIGSHLSEFLLAQGDEVLGIDTFTDYYDPSLKERNVAGLHGREGYQLLRADLLDLPLATVFEGADVIYHLAGQPGVRPSWGEDFTQYLDRNVLVTQRVLEAAREVLPWKLIYASSSSVYGDAEAYPTAETLRPAPISPYGVTKLAAEHLCELYRKAFGVPTVSLRLFTVYGPRQRPDMAFARLMAAALRGEEFPLFGDGKQTRDFTFVHDVVTAMRQAAASSWVGVANIGGGNRVTMGEVIDIVSEVAAPVRVSRRASQHGDVRHTGAAIELAAQAFGYAPVVGIREGLAAMAAAERAGLTAAGGSPAEAAAVLP